MEVLVCGVLLAGAVDGGCCWMVLFDGGCCWMVLWVMVEESKMDGLHGYMGCRHIQPQPHPTTTTPVAGWCWVMVDAAG